MLSHRPALVVLVLFLTLICLAGLRLGVKASALTETDIIEHYSAQYLAQEQAAGRGALRTDCYATMGVDVWTWIEVMCQPATAGSYRYSVGYWGQLLTATRAQLTQLAPQA